MPSGVLAFAELSGADLKKSAFELAGAGRKLAEDLSGPFAMVVVGADVQAAGEALGRRGTPRVYRVEDPALAHYSSEGFATALAEVVGKADPEIVLIAASALGKDLGPALAARIGAPVITDAIDVSVEEGKVKAVRPVYGGKARVTVQPASMPVVLSIRPNVFEPAEERDAKAEDVGISVDLEIRAVVSEVLAPEVRTVDLTESDIIVAGGRGMKGPENFNLVEELAETLGGVVGASRAVVDAGWRPHAEQVGQTGKTVSPKLYVACGISGAIQHLFKIADYGIVGDVLEVLPALTAAVKERESL
jgi:electron transfer flavoprotein alpha subunit